MDLYWSFIDNKIELSGYSAKNLQMFLIDKSNIGFSLDS